MKKMDLDDLISKIQLRYIRRALSASAGSRSEAAKLLGVNRTTLVMRIKKFEEQGQRF